MWKLILKDEFPFFISFSLFDRVGNLPQDGNSFFLLINTILKNVNSSIRFPVQILKTRKFDKIPICYNKIKMELTWNEDDLLMEFDCPLFDAAPSWPMFSAHKFFVRMLSSVSTFSIILASICNREIRHYRMNRIFNRQSPEPVCLFLILSS